MAEKDTATEGDATVVELGPVARRLSPAEKVARANSFRAKSLPGSADIDSTDLIREDRDSR
jgi:hypothetical protein